MKKKVLIFTNLFPNPVEPSRGIFTMHLAASLRRFCNVVVVSPVPWFPDSYLFHGWGKYNRYRNVPQSAEFREVTAYYPRYFMIPKAGGLHPYLMYTGTIKFLEGLHGKERFDAINGQWLFPDGIAASWIGKRLEIPVVLTGLGCDVNLYTKFPLRRSLIRSVLGSSAAVTVVSRELKQVLQGIGIEDRKIRYIPNGVDGDLFWIYDKLSIRKKHRIDPGEKIILYIGRFSEEKGVDILIRSSHLMAEKGIRHKVILIGDGDKYEEYLRLCDSFRLNGILDFLGRKNQEEINEWIGISDLLCLPSRREGMPNVVLESLACGRPVVAASVGALPDLIKSGNGRLVPAENPEALALALEQGLQMDWNPIAIRASIEEYSWESVAKMYYSEIERITR